MHNKSEKEIIEELDYRFRQAVKLQFDKDVQCGYCHLADLSGGLDSRMMNWVAKDMGYDDILNINFCYSNHLDEIISKQVAKRLGNDIIVFPLDTGNFIFNIDETVKGLGGLALYVGNTGFMRLISNLNMKKYGIRHGGNLGDVTIGCFLQSEEEERIVKPAGMYSTKLAECMDDICSQYTDQELYLMNIRGYMANCSCSSGLFRNWAEFISPFQNLEFLEYCMSIPVRLRANHYIYKKWIREKYPEAAKFRWTGSGMSIQVFTEAPLTWLCQRVEKNGAEIIKRLKIKKIITKLSQGKIVFDEKENMNPFEQWYYGNNAIREFMDGYFKKNIGHRMLPENLREQMSMLYYSGKAIEKAQVMTVLSALNLYFGE